MAKHKIVNKNDEIENIERDLIKDKNWKYTGESESKKRPVNSLLSADLDFDTNHTNIAITKEESNNIYKYICLRFKEKTFDNYEFKEIEPEVIEENYDLKLIETNKEIFEMYDKIEREIKKMVDYGGFDL